MSIVITRLTEVELSTDKGSEMRWLSEAEIEQLTERIFDLAVRQSKVREEVLTARLDYPVR
jgi:hypothetical protein